MMDQIQQYRQALQKYKRKIPAFLIDLDAMDHNIAMAKKLLGQQARLVVKSLPSFQLLDYLMEKLNTRRLMVFHEPFLSLLVNHYGDTVDILLGKPMLFDTAKYFYDHLPSNPIPDIQWLIDTEDSLQSYIQLSKRVNRSLSINLEIDVGLHRGGFKDLPSLERALGILQNVPDQLHFKGLMGYDPHIAKIPGWLSSKQQSSKKVQSFYAECKQLIQEQYPALWSEKLTFNAGGSPSLVYHQKDTMANDLAFGSAIIKPCDFDLPELIDFKPACFIAAPILKKMAPTVIPGLERWANLLAAIKPKWKHAYFIYGGHWMADYIFPEDASENQLFGSSTNQSMINTKNGALETGEFLLLRPRQSEAVMLQFEEVLAIRGEEIEAVWRSF